jgi:catechol 2,3-dioxygenase-like lactoylglutathione lyase family enzyme
MIDCSDLDAMTRFWGTVLGLEERARFHGYVFMSRVVKGGPALAFQVVPEPKRAKNRMHLDLAVDDREAFIARALELGATRLEDHTLESGFTWTVMADPEGNEFCVSEEA